jgi:AraC-like DNA-binding protein
MTGFSDRSHLSVQFRRLLGFTSFSRFGQHFKRMHGVEPRRWRALTVAKADRQNGQQLGRRHKSTPSNHRKNGKTSCCS